VTADSLLLEERKYLRDLLRQSDGSQAVVLVGSAARGTYFAPLSDIDVLVVGDVVPPKAPAGVQVLRVSLEELVSRVAAGDELLQWALRFGTPIRGRPLWETLRREALEGAAWPDPRIKVQQAARRNRTARALFDMGDLDAAQEETRFALSHMARARLFSAHVFPLSRPELPGQLRELGDPGLAAALEEANSPDTLHPGRLRALLELLQVRLDGQEPTGPDA
jgi:predicted nucleotidyltransferase